MYLGFFFRPVLFSLFFTSKQFRIVLNSPKQGCVLGEIIWDIGIFPVLNSPEDDEGAMGKIKRAVVVFFPIYSISGGQCACNYTRYDSAAFMSYW